MSEEKNEALEQEASVKIRILELEKEEQMEK